MPWLHSMNGTKLYGPMMPGENVVTGHGLHEPNSTLPFALCFSVDASLSIASSTPPVQNRLPAIVMSNRSRAASKVSSGNR